jgi:hypothetical protein
LVMIILLLEMQMESLEIKILFLEAKTRFGEDLLDHNSNFF